MAQGRDMGTGGSATGVLQSFEVLQEDPSQTEQQQAFALDEGMEVEAFHLSESNCHAAEQADGENGEGTGAHVAGDEEGNNDNALRGEKLLGMKSSETEDKLNQKPLINPPTISLRP